MVLLCLASPGVVIHGQTPAPPPGPSAQGSSLDDILASMSTADRIGQLMLVSFHGSDAAADSDVARLVQELRVGGVILAPENDNFTNESSTPEQVLTLTNSLQGLAFSESRPVTITQTLPVTFTAPIPPGSPGITPTPEVLSTVVTITQQITFPAQGIPLLVAITQEGDGYPNTALRSGFTDLPSAMALGATWKESNAQEVGQVVGRELSAVGVNLLLGPVLDVLVEPRAGPSDFLGTRVFGGDPYWAGQMGQAYVAGVHEGSGWRVATVAKHFPGLGGSDRSLEDEVATVDKSLQDLRLIELPPFFAVAGAGVLTTTTDTLMTAHIRYRGFQGNIRYVTPPISLNAQGMDLIMSQPELVPWRANGGVLVSDSLGVPAIRRYFAPNLDAFPHRQIALDAFLAGNDLLQLTRFSSTDSWDEQMRNIEDTILFFRSRYESDPGFRARVDQAVRRVLQIKQRLYPVFGLEESQVDQGGLTAVGGSQATTADTARQAATLLYPAADELALRMPRPPRPNEDILIFTDAREASECALCPPEYLLDPNSLRNEMLALYGPQETGQVSPERIRSFTFAQLRSYLNSGKPDLDAYLQDAEWIVFAMLNYAPVTDPDSAALKQFLRERATGPEAQKLIVLAYEAPWYLDTTEVSKLTAYYGLYGKTEAFIEISMRALFLEFTPSGRSPVTVEGIGYDLTRQLSPDPGQVIQVLQVEEPAAANATPQPLSLKVGDSLAVRTSVIVDRNGNPVPDLTPVTFRYVYQGEGLGGQTESYTEKGVAVATITLEREGELQISATSDPARNSIPLVVRLSEGMSQILTPTPAPTATPEPSPTAPPSPTSAPTPTPTTVPAISQAVEPLSPPPEPRLRWLDLVLALLGIAAAGGVVYLAGTRARIAVRSWNPPARLALWSGVCGLTGYLVYGLALPGSSFLEPVPAGLRGLLIGMACGMLPLLVIAWFSRRRPERH
jgi:beta-N-acetylhexosaminidase